MSSRTLPVTLKTKLALLTNMIAPHRLPIYSFLGNEFQLLILHGGREANRESWRNCEESLSNAEVVRAWGWQIPHKTKVNGKVFEEKFLHINPGAFWHLLRFRPEAIISNEMGVRSAIALTYGKLFQKPVWIWWGGTLHTERRIDPFRKVIRKIFRFLGDRWITYGQSSTEYLLSLGVKRDRILQSQNSVDEKRFTDKAKPAWIIEPRPVVLHVGRLVELKGIRALLDSAAILQREGYQFSLLLVGDGPDKQTLEHHAVALGLHNVHFRPAQPPARMLSVYRSADLVVFPTLQDVWGVVANEAILAGVPILCSKYAGCAVELFAPEDIFSPDDLNDFSRKLGTAISGGLPKSDAARLKTTNQLGLEMVQELKAFSFRPTSGKQIRPQPIT
jgi:glycosyltransferase involved in cell wall biosynthesis